MLNSKTKNILSIGISTGGSAELKFAKICKEAKVIATTIDENGLEFTKMQLEKHEEGRRVDAKIEDISKKMPYEDDVFDFVYARLVLHYLTKQELVVAFNEIFRVLKPGGIFFVVARSRSEWELQKPEFIISYDEATNITTYYEQWKKDVIRKRQFFSESELKEICENFGFKIKRVKSYKEYLYTDYERTKKSSKPNHLIEVVATKVERWNMKKVKILWSGITGRTGQRALKATHNCTFAEIVAGICRNNEGYYNYNELKNIKEDFDVIVDFSHKDSFDKVLQYALKTKKPIVIGTAGLSDEQVLAIEKASSVIPVFKGGNFRFEVKTFIDGVVNFAKTATDDLILIETHYKTKKIPSETAKLIAKRILNETGKTLKIESRLEYDELVNDYKIGNFHCRVDFEGLANDVIKIASMMVNIKPEGVWNLDRLMDISKVDKLADKEELLKVLDDDGNETGSFEKRSVVHETELFHNEIALWVIDAENKSVLLQRRSPNKKLNPNKLALCAGHVVGDETIDEALQKEAKEEIGIDISNYDVKKLVTIKRVEPKNHNFAHHYYIVARIPVESIKIQEEELTEVLYMDYEKLKKMVQSNDDEVVFKWNDAYKQVFAKLDEIILQ